MTSVVFFILNSVSKGHKILGLLYRVEIELTLKKKMEICDDRHFLSFIVFSLSYCLFYIAFVSGISSTQNWC